MRPIDLPLLAGEHRPAQESLCVAARTEPAHHRAKSALRPRVPELPHHHPEPARAQPWVLRERRLNEGQVWIDETRPWRLLGDRQPALGEHPLDRVVVSPKLGGDRPHRPLIGMVQTENRRALVRRDRAMTSDHDATSRCPSERPLPRTTPATFGTALARPHAAGKYTPAAGAADNADGHVGAWNG